MLAVEDGAEIRRLYRAEGLPIKLIARTLGISRNTVRAALASDGPPSMSANRRAQRWIRSKTPSVPSWRRGADDAGDGDR